jgi:hypothetical protein
MVRLTKINKHGQRVLVRSVLVMMEMYIVVLIVIVLAQLMPIVIKDSTVINPHVMILRVLVSNVLKITDACLNQFVVVMVPPTITQ